MVALQYIITTISIIINSLISAVIAGNSAQTYNIAGDNLILDQNYNFVILPFPEVN